MTCERCWVIGCVEEKEMYGAKEVMCVFRIAVLPEMESDLSVCIVFVKPNVVSVEDNHVTTDIFLNILICSPPRLYNVSLALYVMFHVSLSCLPRLCPISEYLVVV